MTSRHIFYVKSGDFYRYDYMSRKDLKANFVQAENRYRKEARARFRLKFRPRVWIPKPPQYLVGKFKKSSPDTVGAWYMNLEKVVICPTSEDMEFVKAEITDASYEALARAMSCCLVDPSRTCINTDWDGSLLYWYPYKYFDDVFVISMGYDRHDFLEFEVMKKEEVRELVEMWRGF